MNNTCPECRHVLPGGRRCPQPALNGKLFCHHHCRSRNLVEANRARNHSIALPPLEDRAAIQMSLDVVLAAFAAGKINRRIAATYTYAIKVASDNLAKMEQAPPPEPVQICRDQHGDILAAEPAAVSILQSTPVILSDRSEAEGVEGLLAVAEPAVAEPETTPPEPSNQTLEDLRNPAATHEYDPEPPIPLTMTELRKSRLQIEQQLKQQREAQLFWRTSPLAKREGENPQMVIDHIQQKIQKLELELKEITRLQAPDPQAPDPPL